MKARPGQTLFGLIAVSVLVAISLLLVWKRLFWGWIFDDSYIAFRFSDNWATGNGLTWNPGEGPVEGFTSFAWVLTGACVQRVLGIPPHISMVFVGIASWLALAAFLLPMMTEVVTQSPNASDVASARLPGLFTVLILAANPYLAFNAFHGLETALHVLMFCVVIYLALRDSTVALAVASLIAFMVRPDALAFVLPVWGAQFLYSESSSQRRRITLGFLALGVALSVYSLLKWRWFGYPLPNTFYIKQGGLLSGLGYVKSYLLVLSPAWLFLAFAAGRAGISRLLRDRMFVLLSLPAIVFCLAYVKLNPILGEGYRFLVPTLPLIILACLRAYLLARSSPASPGGELAVYLLVMSSAAIVFGFQMYREYSGFQSYFRAIDQRLVATGHNLSNAATLSPPPLLATGDIGAIPYFSKLPTMDIIGLADETVAHDGLTHEYILKRNPDLLILQDLYLLAPRAGEGIVIQVNGVPRTLDMARYGGILKAPEKAHSGAGSTFQVVTTPSFAGNYMYVTDWDFGGRDRYYVFIRRSYAHLDELVRILQQGS
jgi:hypothetical protein